MSPEKFILDGYTRQNTYGGWVGVDLDGTLATHVGDCSHVGEPIPEMLARVQGWLEARVKVKIVTARVSSKNDPAFVARQRQMVQDWCFEHLSTRLDVTAEKDFRMLALWDDRAITVQHNTGKLLTQPLATG